MLSYRFMAMDMAGSRDGTTALDAPDIVDPGGPYNFMVTPTNMAMQMHMIGAMYAPTNSLTLMGMLPVLVNSMEHLTRMGDMFETNASGLGDVKLTALYTFARPSRQRLHAHLGVSLPTGSIDEMDVTPASMGNDVILPYPMQLGSGTVDLLPGLTYLGQSDTWGWGAQARAVVRLGENDRTYTLGNVYGGTAWAARRISHAFSASLRADAQAWGDISGADPVLNPMMVPTADPDRRAGSRLALGFGVNVMVPEGSLGGLRIAVEVERPVYQSLDGPQLETDLMLTVGAQYAFAP